MLSASITMAPGGATAPFCVLAPVLLLLLRAKHANAQPVHDDHDTNAPTTPATTRAAVPVATDAEWAPARNRSCDWGKCRANHICAACGCRFQTVCKECEKKRITQTTDTGGDYSALGAAYGGGGGWRQRRYVSVYCGKAAFSYDTEVCTGINSGFRCDTQPRCKRGQYLKGASVQRNGTCTACPNSTATCADVDFGADDDEECEDDVGTYHRILAWGDPKVSARCTKKKRQEKTHRCG